MRRAYAHIAMAAAAATLGVTGCLSVDLPDAEWVPAGEVQGALQLDIDPDAVSAEPGPRLRIVTFNVLFGEDVPALAAAIRANAALAGADVLMLQEIESYPAEGGSRTAALAAELAMNYAYAPARQEADDGTHGLAILSRFPLERVEVMRLPRFEVAIRTRDRIAMAADVRIGGEALRVVNVHLDTRLNVTQRLAQLHPAVIHNEDRVVIGGDFNTNPFLWVDGFVPIVPVQAVSDFDVAVVVDDYMRGSGFDTPTEDSGVTRPTPGVDLRLDAIYTRGVTAVATGVEHAVQVSDHYPVWVDITSPGRADM